jgi:spermidine synthase
MLGLLPALLHPGPKRAFVVGLGTGSTAGWLADVPGLERVDVAELEPGVERLARDYFAPVNRGVMTKSNVNLIVGDAREALLTAGPRYDLIVSEPSNPYRPGWPPCSPRSSMKPSRPGWRRAAYSASGYRVTRSIPTP